jgi:hypothetical protein
MNKHLLNDPMKEFRENILTRVEENLFRPETTVANQKMSLP